LTAGTVGRQYWRGRPIRGRTQCTQAERKKCPELQKKNTTSQKVLKGRTEKIARKTERKRGRETEKRENGTQPNAAKAGNRRRVIESDAEKGR